MLCWHSQHCKTISYVDALSGIYATLVVTILLHFIKGKVRSLALMIKHQKYLDALSSLGDTSLKERALSLFTCALYGYSWMANIHQVIKCKFKKKSKPKPNGNPFDWIKSIDPTTFPPNYNIPYEQTKRAWYISSIYKNTTEPYPSFKNDPVDYGYQLSKNSSILEMKWFYGNQILRSLEEVPMRMNSLMMMMMILEMMKIMRWW